MNQRRSLVTLCDVAVAIIVIALIIYVSSSYFSRPMEQSPRGSVYSFTLQQIKGNIEPENAYILIQKNKNNSDFIIIDMCTQSEFSYGHIENAVNLDFTSEDFTLRLKNFDKNKTYLIYCASGNQCAKAYTIMMELGFNTVYDLSGGLAAWITNGFPVVR